MKARVMKHNPAFLTREELVQSFVVRHVDLELVLERLREGGEGPNQHILLIGPRGIGKTTLVLRVAAAVEAEPELNKKWYPLVFSEESYEVATAAEFWLEAILHLADQTGDARLHATYDELKKQRDEQRLYEQALARLMDFADAQGKRLLVIVENMNMILGEQL
ncbi:MAG TPA: ATP-binding protein, partial [Microvirga sp.]|nr:ATP-binding protein [Microvirga sp.]